MKMCQTHWNALRKAIADRGLDHLVAKSGEDAFNALMNQVEGRSTPRDFDPLMSANFAIFSAFLQDAGIAGLSFDGCPLCEVAKSPRPKLDEEWINGASDDQLAAARSLKLAAGVQ